MFLPSYSTIKSDVDEPDRWMVLMHGIYGRGGNWRTVARKLVTARPSWGALLVDLRMHGKSLDAKPPHTLDACALDVLSLVDAQEKEGRSIGMVLGHSFGGKVALAMRGQRPDLCPLWMIDSSPSARPGALEDSGNTVVSVLRMLEELPTVYDARADFVQAVQDRGFPKGLAQWLAMNLEPQSGQYRNTLDPHAMREMLRDYFARDLWHVIDEAREPIFVARATRGSAITNADRERLLASPSVRLHEIEGGHWLHVDATDALVAGIAATLV